MAINQTNLEPAEHYETKAYPKLVINRSESTFFSFYFYFWQTPNYLPISSLFSSYDAMSKMVQQLGLWKGAVINIVLQVIRTYYN